MSTKDVGSLLDSLANKEDFDYMLLSPKEDRQNAVVFRIESPLHPMFGETFRLECITK